MDEKRKYYIALNRLYNRIATTVNTTNLECLSFDSASEQILFVAVFDTRISYSDFVKIKRYASKLSYLLYCD